MAKLAFSKLGLKLNNQVVNINYNEQIIEIKQYISVNDKLKLISNIINNTTDEHNFCNPVKVKVYLLIGIIENYTNISFTEKQKEDIVKLYDLIQSNGLFDKILEAIPTEEINDLVNSTWDSVDAIYTYNNSAMGVLDNIGRDYKNTELDIETIQEKLANGENVEFLKDVLAKLG
jgi:hypothetical protein